MQEPTRRLAAHWGLVLAAGSVLAFMFAVGAAEAADRLGLLTGLSGDPFLYAERVAAIVAGGVPYVEVTIEHLPLALIPMFVAYGVSAIAGTGPAVSFALVTAVLLAATGWVVAALGRELSDDLAVGRWLILVLPLLPLVLFRNDALASLLAALALLWMLRDHQAASMLTTLGAIAAKGWPVVLALIDWWKGRRLRAAAAVVFAVGLIAVLLATPGFQAGREFSGIHMESIAGSLVLAWRHVTGRPLDLATFAGATYIQVGQWTLAVNLAIGAAIGVTALTALRRPYQRAATPAVLAVATFAVITASPLLSAQFLLWPTPFLAFSSHRGLQAMWVAMSSATVLSLALWDPGGSWWAGMLLARNALLVSISILTIAWMRRQTDSTSRRNLPV